MKFLSSPAAAPSVVFPSSGARTYVQSTDPALDSPPAVSPYVWYRTDAGGAVIDILVG